MNTKLLLKAIEEAEDGRIADCTATLRKIIAKMEDKNPLVAARFDEFWTIYNNKIGIALCRAKFNKLKMSDVEKIFAHLPGYIKGTIGQGEKDDPKNFKPRRKNPLSYLTGRYYEDQIVVIESEYDKLRRSAK
jgi:hypothetical protein